MLEYVVSVQAVLIVLLAVAYVLAARRGERFYRALLAWSRFFNLLPRRLRRKYANVAPNWRRRGERGV